MRISYLPLFRRYKYIRAQRVWSFFRGNFCFYLNKNATLTRAYYRWYYYALCYCLSIDFTSFCIQITCLYICICYFNFFFSLHTKKIELLSTISSLQPNQIFIIFKPINWTHLNLYLIRIVQNAVSSSVSKSIKKKKYNMYVIKCI